MTEMLEVDRRPRVLLVEDDRSLREALRDMLVDEASRWWGRPAMVARV
jgi:hypothetical protein